MSSPNALNPTRAIYVYVTNATGDSTVASGGATYLFNPTNSTWIKTSEAESMDVSVNWASITGKPTSSAAQIDAAVAASHSLETGVVRTIALHRERAVVEDLARCLGADLVQPAFVDILQQRITLSKTTSLPRWSKTS